METNIYPRDYIPFNVFADAPYDCIISINDRNEGSHVTIHTHKAGLLFLKEQIDLALTKLDKPNKTDNRQQTKRGRGS